MPRLRRLSGIEVLKILQDFGFEVVRIKGSHHILRRTIQIVDQTGDERETTQTLVVPVHGKKEMARGTLREIYRDACQYIPEDELVAHFYHID